MSNIHPNTQKLAHYREMPEQENFLFVYHAIKSFDD